MIASLGIHPEQEQKTSSKEPLFFGDAPRQKPLEIWTPFLKHLLAYALSGALVHTMRAQNPQNVDHSSPRNTVVKINIVMNQIDKDHSTQQLSRKFSVAPMMDWTDKSINSL